MIDVGKTTNGYVTTVSNEDSLLLSYLIVRLKIVDLL